MMEMYESEESFRKELRCQISNRRDNRYHFDFDIHTPDGIRQKKNLISWQRIFKDKGILEGKSFVSGMEGIVIDSTLL